MCQQMSPGVLKTCTLAEKLWRSLQAHDIDRPYLADELGSRPGNTTGDGSNKALDNGGVSKDAPTLYPLDFEAQRSVDEER